MRVYRDPAPRTRGPERRRRYHDLIGVYAAGVTAERVRDLLPAGPVMAPFGGERMRDLVEDGLSHSLFIVQLGQRSRQRDRPAFEPAAAEAPLRAVESERPAVKTMFSKEILSKCFSVVEIHSSPLCIIFSLFSITFDILHRLEHTAQILDNKAFATNQKGET